MNTREIFKEKFEVCLKEIKKQNLRISSVPSIWGVGGFGSFVEEADSILGDVKQICLMHGLNLSINFNLKINEDWPIVSLKDSNKTMYDCYDEGSESIIEEVFSFLDSVYLMVGIPIALLIFGCGGDFDTMQLNTININE